MPDQNPKPWPHNMGERHGSDRPGSQMDRGDLFRPFANAAEGNVHRDPPGDWERVYRPEPRAVWTPPQAPPNFRPKVHTDIIERKHSRVFWTLIILVLVVGLAAAAIVALGAYARAKNTPVAAQDRGVTTVGGDGGAASVLTYVVEGERGKKVNVTYTDGDTETKIDVTLPWRIETSSETFLTTLMVIRDFDRGPKGEIVCQIYSRGNLAGESKSTGAGAPCIVDGPQ